MQFTNQNQISPRCWSIFTPIGESKIFIAGGYNSTQKGLGDGYIVDLKNKKVSKCFNEQKIGADVFTFHKRDENEFQSDIPDQVVGIVYGDRTHPKKPDRRGSKYFVRFTLG